MDDERDFSHLDPANLLPFERSLELDDPNVEKLPRAYQPRDSMNYNLDAL